MMKIEAEDLELELLLAALSKEVHMQFSYFIHAHKFMELLYVLKNKQTIWGIVKHLDIPTIVIIYALDFLQKRELVAYVDGLFVLTIFLPSKDFEHNFYGERLRQVPIYSQLNLTEESSINRGKYILDHAVLNSSLCIIGDDDFLSLSLATTHYFKKIIVINIDARIIEKINQLAKLHNLPVEGVVAEIGKDTLESLHRQFDMVVSDPPYEIGTYKNFLDTSRKLVKNNMFMSQILLSFTPDNMLVDLELESQRLISSYDMLLYKKNCMASHHISESLSERYSTKEEIFSKINSDKSDLDKWLVLSLGRKEYMLHLFLTN